MRRALVSFGLWLAGAVGVLATAFFVAMLLTPGYGDVVIACAAAVAAGVALAAGTAIRRRGRHRRARERGVVAHVRAGGLLEQLAPSRRRWAVTASAAGVLLAAAIAVAVEGSAGGVVLVGVLGVALGLSLVQLVPGASWLRVTSRGVMTRHMGRTRAHRWEDIDGFRVYEVRTRYTVQRLVGWSVSGPRRSARRAARLLRWPSGVDDGLPTEYDTDPEDLAARLQRYREARLDSPSARVRQDAL